ncbi:Protein of unknown function [Bacillus mycoides]|nr:Protein of unknown function [Bacillus mycoides]
MKIDRAKLKTIEYEHKTKKPLPYAIGYQPITGMTLLASVPPLG